jgi:hypothetical protein
MENIFFISLLVSLIAVVVVLYFFKKQNANTSQQFKNQTKTKANKKINDLVFVNNQDRINYIEAILKIHDVTIITWFDDDNGQLENTLYNSIFKANIFLHTEFSSQEVNPETPLILYGHPPLANMEDQIAVKTNSFSVVIIMSSLDDALLQYFVSNKTRKFLDSLGYRDGEVLENTMISKSIGIWRFDLM